MALIIFDLDGTVLDTREDLCDAVNFGLDACGFPKRSCEEVVSFVGNGVRKLVERALPEGEKSAENIEKVNNLFNEYYSVHYADKTRPYDGMSELLEKLKNACCRLVVFSNKPDEFSKGLIERFYHGIFDQTIGSREGFPKKPDPNVELEIMKHFGVSQNATLHVGDSDTDIMTAKNAGVRSIGVCWGYRSKELLISAGASEVAENLDMLYCEIMSWLKMI